MDTIDPTELGLVVPATPPRDPGGPRTITGLLDVVIAEEPDREILVGRHGRYAALGLEKASNRAANALWTLGVRPTDRVAASMPNDESIVVAFLAAMKVGAIWLGINRPLAAPEKAYMLRDSQTSVFLGDPDAVAQVDQHRAELGDLKEVVVVDPGGSADEWGSMLGSAASVRPELETDPYAPAAIAYTSGTTGFPKGAVHTQHNLMLPGKVAAHQGNRPPGGVLGVALPLTILNLMILGPLIAYQNRMRLVAMDRIDAVGMAEWIHAEQITTFSAVPAMVHDLLTHPEVTDEMLSSLDAIGVGGADMPDAFRRLYQERFHRRVGTGYGLTEAPTAVTSEDLEAPELPNSCGRPLPQVSIQILGPSDEELGPGKVGEVCIGPASEGPFADTYRPMLGYWNRPEESRAALRGGLLHTGDMGMLDEDDNLYIKDRKNDLIIRGGSNVYPAEVERVLHEDPRVAACAVVGRPDDRLGERVVALVQPVDGESPDPEELREVCRTQLARYKVPDMIIFVEGFERTPMGKIRKTALRQTEKGIPNRP